MTQPAKKGPPTVVQHYQEDAPLVTLTGKGVAALVSGSVALIIAIGALLTSWVLPVFLEKADERFRLELDRRLRDHEARTHIGGARESYVDMRVDQVLAHMNNLATKADVEALKATVTALGKQIDKLDK